MVLVAQPQARRHRLSCFGKDCHGDATRLRFAVSDGSDLFELMFNASGQNWTLEAIEDR